ncbi:MAG: hypothetical protein LBG83_01065 [Oscillospiraceae bacterium]|jgi:hypothetical protein|nr:hypothetical protein [Oscillospiraceae bacterium]
MSCQNGVNVNIDSVSVETVSSSCGDSVPIRVLPEKIIAIPINDIVFLPGKGIVEILQVDYLLKDYSVPCDAAHGLVVGQTYSGKDTLSFPAEHISSLGVRDWFFSSVNDEPYRQTNHYQSSVNRAIWKPANAELGIFATMGNLTFHYSSTTGREDDYEVPRCCFMMCRPLDYQDPFRDSFQVNFGGYLWERASNNNPQDIGVFHALNDTGYRSFSMTIGDTPNSLRLSWGAAVS